MRNLRNALLNSRIWLYSLVLVAAVSALFALTSPSTATKSLLTIRVVNNSNWEIRHLYLSPADNNNWGDDQLNEAISSGATRNLEVSWDQSTVKLVAEDQDGCFLNTTVETTGSPVWTITTDTVRNCGN